jgi:hypothetical protein
VGETVKWTASLYLWREAELEFEFEFDGGTKRIGEERTRTLTAPNAHLGNAEYSEFDGP